MAVEDPTFGCGTFLPGEGPGNFPDFEGGGTIDGGGGGGTPPGEPDVDVIGPVEPGQGQPPGGPVPPPGFGDYTPAETSQTPGICRCKIDGEPEVQTAPFTPSPEYPCGATRYTVTFKQICASVPPGQTDHDPNSSDTVFAWYVDATSDDSFTYEEVTQEGEYGGDCKENGSCGGDCDDIVITWLQVPVNCDDDGGPQNQCYCVYDQPPETTVTIDGNCKQYESKFEGLCTSLGAPPPDHVADYAASKEAGATGPVTVQYGTVGGPFCNQTDSPGCGGNCSQAYVTWRECNTPSPTTGVSFDDEIEVSTGDGLEDSGEVKYGPTIVVDGGG